MKKIELKKMSLVNFKGIKSLSVDFTNKTDIYGANASGKTTLFDAFTWLLFGKDSTDRKDFEIKTLDSNNQVIPKIDHEVEATLVVNNEEVILRRVFREKWVKQRGAFEPSFTGNETIYYWNEVPMNQKEYTSKIADILDESIFKLISNPLAFNSLKWQDRRNVLTSIADNTDYQNLIKGDRDLEALLQLTEKKTIQEIKAENSSKVKKIKADLDLIPTRIDEVQKSKPIPIDYIGCRKQLNELEQKLNKVDSELLDSSKAYQAELDKKKDIQNKKFEVETELSTLLNKFKSESDNECKVDNSTVDNLRLKIKETENNLQSYRNRISSLEVQKSNLETEIKQLESKAEALRTKWHEENAKELVFNDNEFVCSCCNRPFETDNIESKKSEMITNFNNNKKSILENISSQGKGTKDEITSKNKEIDTLFHRIADGQSVITKQEQDLGMLKSTLELELGKQTNVKDPSCLFNEKVSTSNEVNILKSDIERYNQLLSEEVNIDNQSLLNNKSEIITLIDSVKDKLSTEVTIKRANERIDELQREEQSLANSLNELEKQQFTIERFIKLEIESLENSINGRFKYVSFKLFESQINGGETETCQTLINGVPFSDANTASKINAGLDIINVLNEYYSVSAPIFIDNRESVSELIDTTSQVINLFVSPEDKELRFSCK
ncbi:AAA family ATPase [Myroides odoratimimus]|uniref:AAA family ATPase n=1 Tax=Myroides odoratimimus TaxID=76832 RepID=UPI0004696DA3|nr:AAA family ATPase [Myroides odoratimimus]